MKVLLELIPFFYFQKTRLNNIKAWIFHSYMEWFFAILVLFFLEDYNLISSIKTFSIGYLAFISIYEIGYITNDHLSTKIELNPRKRATSFSEGRMYLAIVIRIVVFLLITYYAGFMALPKWWFIYAILIVSYLFHNTIKNTDYRLFTFVNLCLLRVLIPIVMFVSGEILLLILPSVLLGYVFFRVLIYMDSKDQLSIKSRKQPLYNLSFYLLMLPIVCFISFSVKSVIPIVAYTYFIPLTAVYYLKSKLMD